MKIEKQPMIDELQRQITRRLKSIKMTDDVDDKVFMGEEIGKLEMAIFAVESVDWFS